MTRQSHCWNIATPNIAFSHHPTRIWGPQVHVSRQCQNRPESPLGWAQRLASGKKEAHKIRKMLGTQGLCPWDTRRDKQGPAGRCPIDFLLFAIDKLTEKSRHFYRDTGRRDTRPSKGLQKLYVILSYLLFCSLLLEPRNSQSLRPSVRCRMPNAKSSQETLEKGAECVPAKVPVEHPKTAEKQPKHPKSSCFACFGCFSGGVQLFSWHFTRDLLGCFLGFFPFFFWLFSMSGIRHLSRWPQRSQHQIVRETQRGR